MRYLKIFLIIFVLVGFSYGCSSSQSAEVKVPNFVGLKVSEAQNLAKQNGLILQVVLTEPSDQYPIDTITSQDPPEGEVIKSGGFVRIVLSAGPETISVPNVMGQDFETARNTILDMGLSLGEIKEIESSSQVGVVISQDPDPETVVMPYTKINLSISIGQFIIVPNVIGKSVDEARQIIQSAGLVLYKVDTFSGSGENTPSNIVLYQYPMPNAKVQSGTQVLLRVSK